MVATPTAAAAPSSQRMRHSGHSSSSIWVVIMMMICLLPLTMITAQTCSCSCPTSSVCPLPCQSCTSQSLSCSCTTNCTSLGCSSGTIESAAADTNSCTGGQARRKCTRTNCASTTTSTCASCKSGRYGSGCLNACPGGIADDGTVSNVCNNQGTCSDTGVCTCNSGYTGANCTYSNHGTCNDHGTVAYNGTCACTSLFTGAACDQCVTNQFGSSCNIYCQTNATCTSHGSCGTQGTCSCTSQYSGTACDKCNTDYWGYPSCTYCTVSTCTNNGICSTKNGTCICNSGSTGAACDQCLPNFYGPKCAACPGFGVSVCSGRGTCSQGFSGTGSCTCNIGYAGANCQYSDAITCNGHGTAQFSGSCVCATGFAGSTCSGCDTSYYIYPACAYCSNSVTCNNGGTCNKTSPATCLCSVGYNGTYCDRCATDYYPLAISTPGSLKCGFCKANTTCNAAGTCTAIGTCQCNAHTSGDNCNVCDAGYYGPSCRPCPGGVGNVCNGVGTCDAGFTHTGICSCEQPYQGIDCGLPVLTTTMSPSNGPTQGGTLVRLTGYFLGNATSAVVQFSTYIGATCQNELIHTSNQIVCYAPAGEPLYVNKSGMVAVRVARRDEGVWVYSNNDYIWTYDIPVISALTPSNGPVLGSNQVIIDGSNFGVNTTMVYVGDTLVPDANIISRDHTRVIFRMIPGVGIRTISVRAANRSSIASPIAAYTYDAPNITAIAPSSLSTSGGQTMTLTGINFGNNDNGVYGVLTIIIGASSCSVISSSRTDASVQCNTLAGYGARAATLFVTSNMIASTTFTIPFGAPTIISVTGCIADGVRTTACQAGTKITVTGTNFGVTPAASNGVVALVATVSGVVCTAPSGSHTSFFCTLPVGPTGPGLILTVARGGASASGNFIDYLGPLITNGTLSIYGRPSITAPSLLVVPTTASGTIVAFNGTLLIFGSNNTDVVVRYGPTSQPTKYGCTLREVRPTYIVCMLAAGIGRDHRFIVTSGGVTSPRSADTLSYPPPTLTPSSLRLYPNTTRTGSALLVAATTQGDLIMMEGSGFGSITADVTITYGGYTCITPSTSPQSDRMIICRTSPGEGLNYNFSVTVGRDASWSQTVTSTDQYSYPLSPIVESISGCDVGTGGTTINCPTDGKRANQPVMLTITGRYFTLFPVVTIGDVSCSPVTNLATDPTRVITCPLPVGTGVLQSIIMKQGQYFSRATPLLSYAAPLVTSIQGCSTTVTNPLRAIDCNRTGGDRITVMGTNFGVQLATVLVGGLLCDNVIHNTMTPHQKLTCIVPANVDLGRPIIVFAQGSSQQLANNVVVDYRLCDPGTYASDLDCIACANGTYADQIGSDRCLECPASTYTAGTGSVDCTKCDKGTYADTTGLSACLTCDAGKYTPDIGAVVCLECGIGTFSATNSSTTCTSCTLGKKQSATAQTSCDDCALGSISGAIAQSVCVPCGSGYYAPIAGLSVCAQCAAGNISASISGSTRCDACQAGYFSPTVGLSFCSACVIGRFNSIDSASQCDACARGTYQQYPAMTKCSDCEAGTFATGFASASCSSCPSGYFTDKRAAVECSSCAPGSYSQSSASANCTLCEPGTFQLSAGQNLCNPCGEGTYQQNSSRTYCDRCEAGTAIKVTGATMCVSCTEGHYAPLTGFAECSLCPSGYVANTNGSTTCVPCVAGKFTSSEGSIICDDCDPGKYSFGAATECNNCPAGKTSTIEGDGCVVCDAGFYSYPEGQSVCQPCGYGTYAETTGRTHCDACTSGYVSLELNSTACTTCPEGKYSESTTSCAGCRPGTYSSGGASACTPCAQGSYQSLMNQTGCVPCAKGYVSASMGASQCTPCTAGYYVDTTGQITCFPCDAGSINSVTNATTCSSCTAGTFRAFLAGDQCSICAPGSFNRQSGQSVCASCEAGKYTSLNASQICTSCDPGRYQDASRSTRCNACSVGRYSLGNTASCTICPGGQYQDQEGQTRCKNCRAGTWTDPTLNDTLATCTPCARGFFAPAEASLSCQSCAAGTYAGVLGSVTCIPCVAGLYQSSTAATTCLPCDTGGITASDGASLCEPCIRGTYANATGLTTCAACTAGRFQQDAGHSYCDLCVTGKYQVGQGGYACADCLPGKYNIVNGSTVDCLPCAAGKFQTSPGRSACGDCSMGSFSADASAGIVACTLCLPGTATNTTGSSICPSCDMGKYSGQNAFTCTPCAAGSFAASTQQSSCNLCSTGHYSGEGQLECPACPKGYYQSLQGASTCLACSKATFAGVEGLTVCTSCAAGTKAAYTNQTACDACTAGTYQDIVGRSDCVQCSPGKYSGGTNAITCVACLVNSVAPYYGTAQCLQCSQNAESSDDGQTCLCSAGFYQPPLDANTTTVPCLACPHGADCETKGASLELLAPVAGWWRANNESTQFYKCLLPTHCANVRGDNCLDNRAGPLCALCVAGYRAQSGLGKCVACPTRSTGLGVTIILFILICAAALLMYYLVVRADRALVEQVAEADRRAVFWDQYGVDMDEETVQHSEEGRGQIMYKVKIMVSFMQIVTNMSVVLNVEWPSYFQTFTSYFSFMNLDFVPWQSVGCVSPFNYYAKLIVITTTPIGLVIAISLLYLLPRYLAARAQSAREEVEYAVRSHKRIRRMAWKLMLFTLFLLYPGVSSSILGMFVCRDINGKPYLFNDFSLECYDSSWYYYLPYVLIMVAVYPIGIPLLFWGLLRRYQGRRHEVAIRLQLGFLYEAYNKESWWFELADMANKLIMTSVLPFLPPSGQLPAALAFSVAYMILLVLRPPYRRKGDYRLALVAGVEIMMISLAGLVISKYGSSLDKATDVLLSVLFIAIIFLLLIAFLVLSYLNIVKLLRHMGWQEIKEFVLSGFKTKTERAKQAKQLRDEETEMSSRTELTSVKNKPFSIYDEDPDFGADGAPHISKDPSFLRPLTSIGTTNGNGNGNGSGRDDSLTPIGGDQIDGDDDYKTVPTGLSRKATPAAVRANRGDVMQMSSNPLYEAEKDPFALARSLSQRALTDPRLAALQALRRDDDTIPPPPPPLPPSGSVDDTLAMDDAPPPPPSDPFGGDPFAAAALATSAIPTDDDTTPVQRGRIVF